MLADVEQINVVEFLRQRENASKSEQCKAKKSAGGNLIMRDLVVLRHGFHYDERKFQVVCIHRKFSQVLYMCIIY